MPGAPEEGAVVLINTVTFAGVLLGVSTLGMTVQPAPAGAPAQMKLIGGVKPPRPVATKLYVAACPRGTVFEEEAPEARASEKSCSVPLRLTVCVLPVTPLLLSVMVRVPVREPVSEAPAWGVKVTLMVQEPLTATLEPQLLLWLKLELVLMLLRVSAALPVLERVTACAALVVVANRAAKVRLLGVTPASGAIPVPLRLMVCVLPATPLLLSVRVSVPVRVPVAVGLNVT
jgi:hypothetical protein